MVVYGLKPRFRAALRPVLTFACRFHPNAVSGAAVVFAVLAALALWQAPARPWLLLVAPVLFFLRIAANALDGMVAQERGLASPRGEMVNEFSDRVNDTLILAGLAASGFVPPLLAAAVLVATLLVSYLGILPKAAGGSRRYDGPMGKADRMLLLGLACVVAWVATHWGIGLAAGKAVEVALWLCLALLVGTLMVRWAKAWRELGRPGGDGGGAA
ncbi:MAG: CDP-alcohol phosphatidyltransferase family protein [Thermoplasmatota archaeon]